VLEILVFINLILTVASLALNVAFARILVQRFSGEPAPSSKRDSQLLDLPMRYESQHNYTDLPSPPVTNLQITHKN
jgi:hypothetical protein